MQRSDEYKRLTKELSPKSKNFKNSAKAFLFGGGICFLGELLASLFLYLGLDTKTAYTLVTVTLVLVAAILTGLGIFDKIARHAGAGTLVPVTGFANAVVSPAIDTRSEGFILGVGAKIFTIAGPVILFAVLSGTVYGVIYFVVNLFL